jgi:hypothetical protein
MNSDDEKISGLYHQADTPAPSRDLDDAILAASRNAVDKPAAARGPFSGAWPAAASIAAVIVITIIMVPILKQQEQEQEQEQALTQTSREKSSTRELTDEAAANAYSPAEMKKKTSGAPLPASEPAILPEQSHFADDQAIPVPSGTNSRALRMPAAGVASPAAEEGIRPESDSDNKERSRMQAADSAPFAILTPEMWEVKVSRLIEEGNIAGAKAEIEKLNQRHPEHQINPSLLEQLKSHDE